MKIRDRIVELRRVKARDLVPNERNWRRHPKDQADALRGLLAEVGYADALIAYETPDGLKLIDGHLRAETTPDQEVPVLVLDVTEAEANKLLATIDPLASMAETDASALDALLRDVQTGNAAVQEMLAGMAESAGLYPGETDEAPGDDVPDLPAEPFTRSGDLWLMGDHRLLCGDSTAATDVSRVLGDAAPEVVIFDPPWDEPCALIRPVATPSVLVFTDGRRLGQSIELFGPPLWLFVWDCVTSWYAPNRPLQRGKFCLWYGQSLDTYEFDGAHYGEPDEAKVVSNSRGTYRYVPDARGKHLSDVFQRQITQEHADGAHRHSKPLDWMRMLIGNCTQGDIFDPFCGSGRSILAAEQLKRRCYAVEMDPRYCDAAVRLWENLTGQRAETTDGRRLPEILSAAA